jgi:hypothetical protein
LVLDKLAGSSWGREAMSKVQKIEPLTKSQVGKEGK